MGKARQSKARHGTWFMVDMVPARWVRTLSTSTVAVIQGNVPRAGLDFNAQRRAVLDNHVQRTLELADAVQAAQVPVVAAVRLGGASGPAAESAAALGLRGGRQAQGLEPGIRAVLRCLDRQCSAGLAAACFTVSALP